MDIKRLKSQLKRHEGLRLKIYSDTEGVPTVGYGRNLRDVGISRLEAEVLLDNDINRTLVGLSKALPWLDKLDAVRREAIVNMAFNLGVAGLLGFKTMLAALEVSDWEGAARSVQASKYAKQVGRRAIEIGHMLRHGAYPE